MCALNIVWGFKREECVFHFIVADCTADIRETESLSSSAKISSDFSYVSVARNACSRTGELPPSPSTASDAVLFGKKSLAPQSAQKSAQNWSTWWNNLELQSQKFLSFLEWICTTYIHSFIHLLLLGRSRVMLVAGAFPSWHILDVSPVHHRPHIFRCVKYFAVIIATIFTFQY